ncbi:MAG: RNA methyltransferase [Waddliaceae bacterium]|nr:RNA methyltransferase [Waddliaceae bacterium]
MAATMTLVITSPQNPVVKRLVKLRDDSSYREEENSAIVVGRKMVSEAQNHTTLKTVIILDEGDIPSNIKCDNIIMVTPEIMKKVSGVKNPEPIIAEVVITTMPITDDMRFFVVLENISDPGNMGTLIRTALALGWDAVVIVGDSVDIYNDKALRAAKGATFRIPIVKLSLEDLKKLLENKDVPLYIADMAGDDISSIENRDSAALLLGSEAHGASAKAKDAGTLVSIPMSGDIESLNVAAAGSILMYIMKK